MALASFMKGVAEERRQQGKEMLFLGGGPALLERKAAEAAHKHDWKFDDGRMAYFKEDRRYVSAPNGYGEDILIQSGRRQARRLDFRYTGHYAVPPASALAQRGA
mmetsp:Transcript_97973/g.227188  ORF Transcript_97973/g.227188 Transcript_97973/m.227188 type:complete len:105 (-) Transcript_97973:111-425(-)